MRRQHPRTGHALGRQTPRALSIRLKLIVPMSLMILVLIGSSLLATLWLLQRQQHAELRDILGRTAQVAETLLEAQRQSLEHQAKLVGELPILTTVVESGDPGTIRDSAQTYHA